MDVSAHDIRQGFWVDWSHGRVLGATVTTTSTSGNILIALIAVIVSLATDHLWNLILFTLHQSRAARTTGDAMFQQEQAILRSLPTPGLILIDIANMVWAWRKSTAVVSRPLVRMLVIAVVTLTFGVVALATSIFSSYIVDTSHVQVLTVAKSCAVDIDFKAASQQLSSVLRWETPLLSFGQSYADDCYGNQAEMFMCDTFVQPNITWSQEAVACPFTSADLCVGSNPTSVLIDSGLLDSHHVFGINDRPENRVFFRRRTTYTPLRVEGYYAVVNDSRAFQSLAANPLLPGETYIAFNYGPNPDLPDDAPRSNITLLHPSYNDQIVDRYVNTPFIHYADEELGATFEPIPELATLDADLVVDFVLSNSVVSLTPIDDPVFSAHKVRYCNEFFAACTDSPGPNHTSAAYLPDHPAGVIAGQQQYQACLSDQSGAAYQCTNLTGSLSGRVQSLFPSANDAQRTTLNFLAALFFMFDLGITFDPAPLKASQSLSEGFQSGLPSDQWVTEVRGWEAMILATIQNAVAKHAVGYGHSSTGLVPPNNTAQAQFCQSQKVVRSGGFANINVFGLSFVLVVSCIVIAVDVCVLKIVVFLIKRPQLVEPRVRRWIQDGVVQLQRRAYEADGIGPWERLDREVPVLEENRVLPSFHTDTFRASVAVTTSSLLRYTSTIESDEKYGVVASAATVGGASSSIGGGYSDPILWPPISPTSPQSQTRRDADTNSVVPLEPSPGLAYQAHFQNRL